MYNIRNVHRHSLSLVLNFTRANSISDTSLLLKVKRTAVQHNSRTLSSLSFLPIDSRLKTSSEKDLLSKYYGNDTVKHCTNRRLFSQKAGSNNNDNDDPKNPEDAAAADDYIVHQHLPATVVVPEVWPHVPLIAVNRNPLFPRFIKLIDVSIYPTKIKGAAIILTIYNNFYDNVYTLAQFKLYQRVTRSLVFHQEKE